MHFAYSVNDIAERFDVHPQTVRNWIKGGLPTIDQSRPVLIHGTELKEFLRVRNKRNKRRCAINEIYCLPCRKPQVPAGGMVDYEPNDEIKGCLIGLCPSCDRVINRYASLESIKQVKQKLDVTIRPIKNT